MAWSSSNYVQTPGPTVILAATTAVSTGNWFRVNEKLSGWGFGINQTGSSVASTVTSSGVIEGSFDAVTACENVLATWSLNGTAAGSPGATLIGVASSLQAQYPYVRARIVTITASSVGAVGTPGGVQVTMTCQQRSL